MKFWTLLLIVVLSSLVGGIYGIIHDQITYTISPEYYTKFKFYQFGLIEKGYEAALVNVRIKVSIVGFLATWWMGLLIGLILGLVGLKHNNNYQMFISSLKAIVLTVFVAFAIGLIGLTFGKLYLANSGVRWHLPDNLQDTNNFIAVGSMHNFSYLGGLIGLVIGVIYSIKQKRKNNIIVSI